MDHDVCVTMCLYVHLSKENQKKKSIFDAVDNLDFVTYALPAKVGVCVTSRAAQIVRMLPRQRAWGGWWWGGGGHFRGCAKHSETYQKNRLLLSHRGKVG